MQWLVITVLIVGAGAGAYLLINKVNSLSDENLVLTGNNASLANQLRQAKAQIPSPTPEPTVTPEPSPTPAPAAAPTPAATPKATKATPQP